jgi:hypothetical protein
LTTEATLLALFTLLFFFLVVLGFELAKQVLYHLSHSTSPFALVIFWIGSHVYTQAGLDLDPPNYDHAQIFID